MKAGDSNGSPLAPLSNGGCACVNRAGREALAAGADHAIRASMPDERALAAIARIERALARIEAAADRHAAAPRPDGELRELKQVHEALRGKVEGAIAQIDRLIATAERS